MTGPASVTSAGPGLSPSRLAATVVVAGAGTALALPLLSGAATPPVAPLLLCVLSVVSLLLRARRARGTFGAFCHAGFHGGMFAFFLVSPLFWGATAEALAPRTYLTIVAALALTMVGFEAGYGRGVRAGTEAPGPPPDAGGRRHVLLLALVVGGALWFLTFVDVARAYGVPVSRILFTMRGRVEGAEMSVSPSLGYLGWVLRGGIFLSASVGGVLLCLRRPAGPVTTLIGAASLLACALSGFLSGTRAFFLYSAVPLLAAIWVRFGGRLRTPALRLAVVGIGGGAVLLSWGAMSAMRGGDVREYAEGWEGITRSEHVRGALDVYGQLPLIVESFPTAEPYQKGRSLVPLVLGWVPRPLWPDKPYPFSLFANTLRGETLESRAASIAVGLTGEGYGNLGFPGCFLWGLLMGLACRWGDRSLDRLRAPEPLRLQLAAMGAIWAAMLVRGGVPEMFYMGVGTMLFPWALSAWLSRPEARASSSPAPVPA